MIKPGKDFTISDEALMVRVGGGGDTAAFTVLYERHAVLALRVAREVVQDRDRAAEVVQDSFLTIWRSREGFRTERGSFKAWAMRIVRNRAIDQRRGMAIRPVSSSFEVDPEASDLRDSTPDVTIARFARADLLESLRRLPPVQAEAVVLAFLAELSHPEIALALALPPGTVKGRIRAGLTGLSFQLSDAGLGHR